jgi:hypothetical protein
MVVGNTREEEQVSAVREFNRFYTARLGLLRTRQLTSIGRAHEASGFLPRQLCVMRW